MDFDTFLFILTGITIVSPYLVSVIKGILNDMKVNYSSNLLAVISSCVLSVLMCFINHDINMDTVICCIALCICSSMSSMLGYDKVKQMILQLKDIKKGA